MLLAQRNLKKEVEEEAPAWGRGTSEVEAARVRS